MISSLGDASWKGGLWRMCSNLLITSCRRKRNTAIVILQYAWEFDEQSVQLVELIQNPIGLPDGSLPVTRRNRDRLLSSPRIYYRIRPNPNDPPACQVLTIHDQVPERQMELDGLFPVALHNGGNIRDWNRDPFDCSRRFNWFGVSRYI